jgi:DNA-binding MarR family transcriptional regulator
VEPAVRRRGLVSRAARFEQESGPLPDRLVTGLAKVGMALRHAARLEARSYDLSPTQAEILVLLDRRDGPRSPGALARGLGVGLPTVSEALAALVAKGLVRRRRAAADARSVALALTPAGRRRARALAGWPEALLLADLQSLSPDEQAVLLRTVTKLIRSLQGRGLIPVARMCATCRFFRPHVHSDPERPHHCAFVDAPFGDASLRLDCPDHEPVPPRRAEGFRPVQAVVGAKAPQDSSGGGFLADRAFAVSRASTERSHGRRAPGTGVAPSQERLARQRQP